MRNVILLLALVALCQALPAIHAKGVKLFYPNGTQFYVIGVDYAPSVAPNGDPIADTAGLNRDIPYLKQLGVNVIRVYSFNAGSDHSAGMALLEAAGIYVILDTTEPNFSINANSPAWNLDLFTNIKAKINNFARYTNVFAFLSGNEVVNTFNQTIAGPYIKASVRDVKAYLRSINSTALVGYAATDNEPNDFIQPYLNCNSDDTSVDFYGINTYRFCAGGTFQTSGYSRFLAPYYKPVIFTEYGCNINLPRVFDEVNSIYGTDLAATLSGGLVYQYSNESLTGGFGLVVINTDNSVTLLADFNNLKSKLAAITPPAVTEASYTAPTQTLLPCPIQNGSFLAVPLPLPPTPDVTVCSCFNASQTCVVKSTTTPAAIASAVQTACSGYPTGCAVIAADSLTGVYGQYSGCNSIERSNIALTNYVKNVRQSTCNFNGAAQVTVATTPAGCNTVATTSTTSGASGTTSSNNNVVTPSTTSNDNDNVASRTTSGNNASGAGANSSASTIAVSSVAVLALVVLLF